jgi:hypothetical protein
MENPKENITAYLESECVSVIDAIAIRNRRSRNYVIATILKSFTTLSIEQQREMFTALGCWELTNG